MYTFFSQCKSSTYKKDDILHELLKNYLSDILHPIIFASSQQLSNRALYYITEYIIKLYLGISQTFESYGAMK